MSVYRTLATLKTNWFKKGRILVTACFQKFQTWQLLPWNATLQAVKDVMFWIGSKSVVHLQCFSKLMGHHQWTHFHDSKWCIFSMPYSEDETSSGDGLKFFKGYVDEVRVYRGLRNDVNWFEKDKEGDSGIAYFRFNPSSGSSSSKQTYLPMSQDCMTVECSSRSFL